MLTWTTVEAALAVSAVSITINRGSVTRGLRDWLKQQRKVGKKPNVLAQLVNCPYCLAHWGAVAVAWRIAPIYRDVPLSWFDYVVQAGAIVGLSALFIGAAYTLLHWDEIELDQARQENAKLSDELDQANEVIRELTQPPQVVELVAKV